MRVLLVLFLTVLAFTADASSTSTNLRVAARTYAAVENVIHRSTWPSIPTSNIRYANLSDPGSLENQLFVRLINKSGLAASGFTLKSGGIHNVVCDSQRKFVIADPEWISALKSETAHPDLALTALFAHELGHYILDAYRLMNKREIFGSSPFRVLDETIPTADNEHAQVEPIAAELMRRAGFTGEEIVQGFTDYQGWLVKLEAAFAADGYDPSTDAKTRLLVFKAYRAEALKL